MESGGLNRSLGHYPATFKAVSDNDVALVFVVVQGAVVDHMISSCPVERKVVGSCHDPRHKVANRFVLTDNLVVCIAVHVPDLH